MNGPLRTTLLLASLTALFVTLGTSVAGRVGAVGALLAAIAMNFVTFWNADRIVLAMHGAREVDADRCPKLVGLVHELAARAGLPPPKVYVIDSPHPNAFATGRDPAHAAVAATTGLLGLLTRDEIAAVMAHELGHVRNHDTLVMTLTATLAGAIGLLANWGMLFGGGRSRDGNPLAMLLALLVAPFAAILVQLAISRNREFGADRAAAEISGKPHALASALTKLAAGAAALPSPVASRNPGVAALYIVPSLRGGASRWFSTHPDTAKRIAALEAMTGERDSGRRTSVPRSVARFKAASALDPLRAGR